MENDRDKFVVILAGYTDEMKVLIETNPGLKHRFPRYFTFFDYLPEELFEIFERIATSEEWSLSQRQSQHLLDFLLIPMNQETFTLVMNVLGEMFLRKFSEHRASA